MGYAGCARPAQRNYCLVAPLRAHIDFAEEYLNYMLGRKCSPAWAQKKRLSLLCADAPGFRTVELSDMEKLLKTIENDSTLETLKKVVQNTAQAPAEAKFRKLKLSSPKVKEVIVDVPAALQALLDFGWVKVRCAVSLATGRG